MGHAERGSENTIRNIVYTRLSPFELSVWKSIVWSMKTVPRRLMNQAPYILFPITFIYLTMDWADRVNWESHRKNPADYENDV